MKLSHLAALMLLFGFGGAYAEHPEEHPSQADSNEHPDAANAAEHPEHPSAAPLTTEDVADAAAEAIKARTADTEGWFVIRDDKTGSEMKLWFDYVHRERLSQTGEQTYFVCANFHTEKGDTFDLDWWMKGESAEQLSFEEVAIHKENGVERYGWAEKDGVWVKVEAE